MTKTKEILCLSGGIDSTIAWFYLNKPKSIYFDLGHRYASKELQAIQRISGIYPEFAPEIIHSLKLNSLEQDSGYIPNRNLLIATIASNYGTDIYLCGIKGDKVEDKNPEAFRAMSYVINATRKPEDGIIDIKSPFWDKTKSDIIKWFIGHETRALEILRETVSCYDPSGHQCGKCAACFRKWIALEVVGIDCSDWFESDISKWDGIKHYIDNIAQYDIVRQRDMKSVLSRYGHQNL